MTMFCRAFRSSLSSSLRFPGGAPSRTSLSTAIRLAQHQQQQLRLLSQEACSRIDKAVSSRPLVLFMKGTPDLPQCGFSRAVVQLLEINGVPPEKMQSYDVLEDAELRSGIKEYSDWPTIPQLYVAGEFVGGCDIVFGMHQSGELEKLLQQHDIISKPSEVAGTSNRHGNP